MWQNSQTENTCIMMGLNLKKKNRKSSKKVSLDDLVKFYKIIFFIWRKKTDNLVKNVLDDLVKYVLVPLDHQYIYIVSLTRQSLFMAQRKLVKYILLNNNNVNQIICN